EEKNRRWGRDKKTCSKGYKKSVGPERGDRHAGPARTLSPLFGIPTACRRSPRHIRSPCRGLTNLPDSQPAQRSKSAIFRCRAPPAGLSLVAASDRARDRGGKASTTFCRAFGAAHAGIPVRPECEGRLHPETQFP